MVWFILLHYIYYYNRKGTVIVENLTILTIHRGILIIVALQSKSHRLVVDNGFIIGYYTVKFDRVSDRYLFYYNSC